MERKSFEVNMSMVQVPRYLLEIFMDSFFKDEKKPVRFDYLMDLYKSLGKDMKKLKDIATVAINDGWDVQPMDDAPENRTCTLSAYLVNRAPEPFLEILNNNEFDLVHRLEYAKDIGKGTYILSKKYDLDHASKVFGIPLELLAMLESRSLVVAGGAAMYLECPKSLWDYSCDIDFFVLDTKKRDSIVTDLIKAIPDEYVICQYGPSVLTAVGPYGSRRIQIIASSAKTFEELITKFDLNIIKACIDAENIYYTCSAKYDWIRQKCSNGSINPIKPRRLARAYLKGFDLSDDAKQQLANTVGWPLPEKFVDKLLYDFPCLTPGVPKKVQYMMLQKMGLKPIEGNPEFEGSGLRVMGNSYGPSGIYTGDMTDLVETVEVDENRLKFLQKKSSSSGMVLYPLKTKYLVSLPLSYFPFEWDPKKEPDQPGGQICKITIDKRDEVQTFSKWHDLIVKKFFPDCEVSTLENKYPDIHVRVDSRCSWWKNGIKQDAPFPVFPGDMVKAVGKIDKIISHGNTNFNRHEQEKTISSLVCGKHTYLQFDLKVMYIQSRDPIMFSDDDVWRKREEKKEVEDSLENLEKDIESFDDENEEEDSLENFQTI